MKAFCDAVEAFDVITQALQPQRKPCEYLIMHHWHGEQSPFFWPKPLGAGASYLQTFAYLWLQVATLARAM